MVVVLVSVRKQSAEPSPPNPALPGLLLTATMGKSSAHRESRTWTRDEIAARILDGDNIVIYRGRIIRIPAAWLAAHPGGELAIQHFVGRDASDEVDAFHSDETLKRINSYAVGHVALDEQGWIPFVPPIMSGWVRRINNDGCEGWHNEATAIRSTTNTELFPSSEILLVGREDGPTQEFYLTLPYEVIVPPPSTLSLTSQTQQSAAYKILHQRVIDAGLYKTPYLTGYGPEALRYCLLGGLAFWSYSQAWFIPSAVFLGLLWHQLAFTAHDLGHLGVTHNWVADRVLGICIADFIGGLSIGWWVHVSELDSVPFRC